MEAVGSARSSVSLDALSPILAVIQRKEGVDQFQRPALAIVPGAPGPAAMPARHAEGADSPISFFVVVDRGNHFAERVDQLNFFAAFRQLAGPIADDSFAAAVFRPEGIGICADYQKTTFGDADRRKCISNSSVKTPSFNADRVCAGVVEFDEIFRIKMALLVIGNFGDNNARLY